MKKLLAIVLTLSMVASLGLAAFAEKGGFVYSPSMNPAPVIVDQEHPDDDCSGKLSVTPYGERSTLDEGSCSELEQAYEDILGLGEGDDLYALIKKLAEEHGIPVDMLLVSDLFYMNYVDCEDGETHVPYSVKLSSDAFNNFVGLVHFEDGKWVSVDGATIDENGILTFSYDGFGAFAVLVDTSDAGSPVTGDNGIFIFCIVMMAVSAVGFVTVFAVAKKKKAVKGR